ncbi:prolipoprotein diacylglyceryl transferase [Candidatus Falkowbacteria bacterium]|nr:prolipoprotein diacylglyceryl transferase [Candidatus Falkowbacteria bacterium]
MFLHTYHPTPYLAEFGILKIHWYGLLMVIGGLIGLFLVLRLAKFYEIKKNDIFDLAVYWLVFSIISARVYYVVYAWELYKDNLLDILKIWQGGLAVHGIMIGGFAATIMFAQGKKINIWQLLDLSAIGLCAAQIIGRWGNYFNQEIFGKPTSLGWGIPIDSVLRPAQYSGFEFFHPTVLYESLGNVVVLSILLVLFFMVETRYISSVRVSGLVFFGYLILYSILRFCLEFVRIDYSPLLFGVRWAQIISAGLFVFGVVILSWQLMRKIKQK